MKPRVLIVDDEFGLAEVIAEILCERGYDAVIAMNGKLALASMQQTPPQFVLLDVMMPVMDGPTLLKQIQHDAQLASIPVALMSSLAESSVGAVRGLYREFVRKPFTPKELYELVERHAGRP